jgi:hypothetical protein
MAPLEWVISYKLGQICSMNLKPEFTYELCFNTEFSLIKDSAHVRFSAHELHDYLVLTTDITFKIMTLDVSDILKISIL